MSYRVRTLSPSDVPATMNLLNAAFGRNVSFEPRLQRAMSPQPDG
jgi:hypothetical protein